MADSQLRTLIALGAFSPVGGGGGDIPEDLCVSTVKATTSITTPAGTITNLKASSVESCSVAAAAADIVSLVATGLEAETIYSPAGTVDSLSSTDIESGSIYAASGTIDSLSATTIAAGTVDATSVEADTLYSPSGTVDSLTSEDITTCSVIAGSVRTCSVQSTSATVTGTSSLAQVTADILTVAGSAYSPTVHTNSLYLSTGAGSEGELKYDTSQSALTWAGSKIGGDVPKNLCVCTLKATSNINANKLSLWRDYVGSNTFELKYDPYYEKLVFNSQTVQFNGYRKQYPYNTYSSTVLNIRSPYIWEIQTDSALYPNFDFTNTVFDDTYATVEIWLQVGTRVPTAVTFPSTWKWLDNPLPETFKANSHYCIVLRNIPGPNYSKITLANMAYCYEPEEE